MIEHFHRVVVKGYVESRSLDSLLVGVALGVVLRLLGLVANGVLGSRGTNTS